MFLQQRVPGTNAQNTSNNKHTADDAGFTRMSGSGACGSEVFIAHALGRGQAGRLWKINRRAILRNRCKRPGRVMLWTRGVNSLI